MRCADRRALLRDEQADHDDDHSGADEQVAHELAVDGARLLPEEERARVGEGTRHALVDRLAQRDERVVPVAPDVGLLERGHGRDARRSQPELLLAAPVLVVVVALGVDPLDRGRELAARAVQPLEQLPVEDVLALEEAVPVEPRRVGLLGVREERRAPVGHVLVLIDVLGRVEEGRERLEAALLCKVVAFDRVHGEWRALREERVVEREEALHVRVVRDEPLEAEVGVNPARAGRADRKDGGKDGEHQGLARTRDDRARERAKAALERVVGELDARRRGHAAAAARVVERVLLARAQAAEHVVPLALNAARIEEEDGQEDGQLEGEAKHDAHPCVEAERLQCGQHRTRADEEGERIGERRDEDRDAAVLGRGDAPLLRARRRVDQRRPVVLAHLRRTARVGRWAANGSRVW